MDVLVPLSNNNKKKINNPSRFEASTNSANSPSFDNIFQNSGFMTQNNNLSSNHKSDTNEHTFGDSGSAYQIGDPRGNTYSYYNSTSAPFHPKLSDSFKFNTSNDFSREPNIQHSNFSNDTPLGFKPSQHLSSFNNTSEQQSFSQPRAISYGQSGVDNNSVHFQFPLNSVPTYGNNEALNTNHNYHSTQTNSQFSFINPYSASGSSSSLPATNSPLNGSYNISQQQQPSSRHLPQVSFPFNGSQQQQSLYQHQPQLQQQQQHQQHQQQLQHQQQHQQQSPITPGTPMSTSSSYFTTNSSHDAFYQQRSQSYNDSYAYQQQLQQRRHNWNSQPVISETHKPEVFTEEDTRVLKSLLFNGEKVKWRYISSKLSAVTGRRATSTACMKKTREIFELPSDKAAGSLGTSLPYAVHNSWGSIVEEELG